MQYDEMRTLQVTRTIGDFTYSMTKSVSLDPKDPGAAVKLMTAHYQAMYSALLVATNPIVEHNIAALFKQPPASQSDERPRNYPAGVEFDPAGPIYEVIKLDVVVAKGKRYIKALTEKVQDYGFPVWPDFPEKDQWKTLSQCVGFDVEHCDPNLYDLDPAHRFGIRLGKAKSQGKLVSKIMEYVWDYTDEQAG